MKVETSKVTAAEVLSLVDDLIGDNPWVRLGASAAVGVAAGLFGRSLVRSGFRFALAAGARRLVRVAFDAAFEAGHRDGARLAGAGVQRTAPAYAADRY
ncbi:MAG TPA: hypothetical protein VM261_21655 [Kofleriaceae bacterium]|nr:hypothetical protein [Kofleriaceae bacterium]